MISLTLKKNIKKYIGNVRNLPARKTKLKTLFNIKLMHILPAAAHSGAVQTPHRVLRVAGILHLHEGEARGPPRHPDVAHGAVLGERVLQVVSAIKTF